MAHTSFPDQNDVERVLRSTGLFSSTELAAAVLDLDLESVAAAASREWEEATGWVPFVKDASDVTRYFDPQGPNFRPHTLGGSYTLSLGTGLLTTTSIHAGWSPASDGSLLTLNTDYYLKPYNAGTLLRPPTEIEFIAGSWGARRSIRIIGRFGYSATVPDDAWLAVAHRAVAMVLPEIALRVSGGMVEWKEAETSERYGDAFLTGEKGIGGRWEAEWRKVTSRYMRVVL